MSEETDALNQRIRDLTEQVSVLERKAAETGDMLERMTANGLDKLLTGRGLFEFGGGVGRLDDTGIQIATTAFGQKGIYFPATFTKTPSAEALPYIEATNSGGVQEILVKAVDAYSNFAEYYGMAASSFVSMDAMADYVAGSTYARIRFYATANESYVRVDGGPLYFVGVAADPSGVLRDGELWYRSDTDKFRARINGVTENLATESYVAANAGGSSWTGKKVLSAASTNATSVKASSGTLGPIVMVNTNASVRYLKLYDKASAPTVGTDTPKLTFALPSGVAVALSTDTGIPFGTGIAYALTTGAADSDTAAVAANEITGVICYA